MLVFTGRMPVPLSENLFDLDLTADDTEVVPPEYRTPNSGGLTSVSAAIVIE